MMATLDPIEKEVARNEAYFTDGEGRTVGICHVPYKELSSDDFKYRVAALLPDTARLSPPECADNEQLAMFIVDGQLEWRVEDRPPTPEELAVAPLKAMLERIEAKLDAHIASSAVR